MERSNHKVVVIINNKVVIINKNTWFRESHVTWQIRQTFSYIG